MFRLLVVLSVFVATIPCTTVNAQGGKGRWHRGGGKGLLMRAVGRAGSSRSRPANRHQFDYRAGSPRSYSPPPLGMSFGSGVDPAYGPSQSGYYDPFRFDGYGYDPYRYGSFRAPDLLDDPTFTERYRYDSRFPGRYRSGR